MEMFAMPTGNIILLVVLAALLILYPVLMISRNKKEQAKQQQMVEALKVGEYVLTYSGIFGKITEIIEKEAGKFMVIETGEKEKNYITVSENAIYTVTNNNPKVYLKDDKTKEKDEPVKSTKSQKTTKAKKDNAK